MTLGTAVSYMILSLAENDVFENSRVRSPLSPSRRCSLKEPGTMVMMPEDDCRESSSKLREERHAGGERPK